jgi:hypothetical protein
VGAPPEGRQAGERRKGCGWKVGLPANGGMESVGAADEVGMRVGAEGEVGMRVGAIVAGCVRRKREKERGIQSAQK